jgi:hypothetical protein
VLDGDLIMASERQIAANRRNARKSTRPRSGAGKNRSSRNAYRHDLTFGITSTAALAKLLDKLARKIAGDTKDPILLERARAVAQAQFDLARVRQAKAALIERASAFEALDPPRILSPESSVSSMRLTQVRVILPKPFDASATMPSQEPDRSAEAIRRVLPELRRLDRYERRAAARRDRAVLDLLVEQIEQQLLVAKRAIFSPILMACETSGCHARPAWPEACPRAPHCGSARSRPWETCVGQK